MQLQKQAQAKAEELCKHLYLTCTGRLWTQSQHRSRASACKEPSIRRTSRGGGGSAGRRAQLGGTQMAWTYGGALSANVKTVTSLT